MPDQDDDVPAWQRKTEGESRWAATLAVLVIVVLQVVPKELRQQPAWLVLPVLEVLLLGVLVAANPFRLNREERWLRNGGLLLTGLLSLATAVSAGRLVFQLINGTLSDPVQLLVSGGAVWLTNVVVFGLWYWESDRGGPAARAHARKPLPDFLFVQMQSPDLTEPEWEPQFLDYLYLAFTNATAFSPTDVMPMSRWAKATMMLQSAISLVLVILVIARAINVLQQPGS
ncbi:DUF1345 domain-containing protein [Nocardia vinacea]|uniref:DUF1345 domain-containing protein n=1 Tax=Nocardia vinacea TaxID=96468 RepID=A0ABZ1Z528_9NOCA|nr:DUF1345 domain-containing protein [Nocardia vinacea]